MLRVTFVLVLALLLVPGASAAAIPFTSVKLAPPEDGQVGDPYYLWVNLTQAQSPRPAKPTDDCWRDDVRPPPSPDGVAQGLAADLASWSPLEEFSFSHWFPTCVATEVRQEGASADDGTRARASYDVSTGRYFVEAEAPVPGGLPTGPLPIGFSFTTATGVLLTGTTGVTMVADCEGCPPPTCC